MNVCSFVGRLTDDPQVGQDRKGDPYASFTLAVQRRFDRDKADFIRCMAFGKPADIIDEHCRKGLRLAVSGTLQIEDADNEYFGRATLMVDQFTLVEFADDNGDRGGGRDRDRGNRGGGRDRGRDRGGRSDRGGGSDRGGRGRDDDRRGSSRDRNYDGDRGRGRDDRSGGSNRGNDRGGGGNSGPAPAEDEYDPFADE